MINKVLDQFNIDNLESLSGMDATFLYGETETSPMHVGSVAIIEGELDFKTFKNTIASRIHQIPKLRKRLMTIPMSIDYPYWADDPNFDIDLHIRHVALPKPGGWKQLRRMASRIFSDPLDQSRPLWSFTFVEGLDNLSQVKSGSVAVISKIHHVAVDGVAGASLLAILFDLSPKAPALKEAPPYNPDPLPNELALLAKSSLSFAQKPLKFPKLIQSALASTVKAGFLTRVQHLDLPTAPFTAPKTPLNGIIAARRKWNTTILSLDRVKALRKIMGTTLNDIILAICAGALRRYLLEKNKLPKKPLVAMVPISTRDRQNQEQTGNQLSAMLVQLATHIEDPIERLETIYENTIKGKTYQGAMGAKNLTNLAEMVPFGIANQAARLYTRYNVAKLHNPVFNVVITNVPGPQMPIYLGGHKLHSIMGMAPIIDGMGLIITVLSYNGSITISPTSDINSMPDLDVFSDFMLEEANLLEEHIHEYAKNKKKEKQKGPTPEVVDTIIDRSLDHVKKQLKANPEIGNNLSGTIQFLVKGSEAGNFYFRSSKERVIIRKSRAKDANISITLKAKYLEPLMNAKLDVHEAIIQGRLLYTGDEKMIDQLEQLLLGVNG